MERLQAYRARLIIFPRRSGAHKTLDASKEDLAAFKDGGDGAALKRIGTALRITDSARANAVGEVKRAEIGEGTKDAYRVLRDRRSEARLVGVREKRAKAKADEAQATKK